jgi:hypothetical protein
VLPAVLLQFRSVQAVRDLAKVLETNVTRRNSSSPKSNRSAVALRYSVSLRNRPKETCD